MNWKRKILKSRKDSLVKLCYTDWWLGYACVVFLDNRDGTPTICASSQMWCNEACLFCMTGSKALKKNLTKEQIYQQFLDSLDILLQSWAKQEKLYVIMEWMGEAYYNLDNVFSAFVDFLQVIHREYKLIVFSISTVGNIWLIEPYIDFVKIHQNDFYNVKYQFQLSLHTPFDLERKKIMPVVAKKYSIAMILEAFYGLADFLSIPLKCNYLLLNYPWWGSNYTSFHLEELSKILDHNKTKIKLTKYSETWMGFSSPDTLVFEKFQLDLQKSGLSVWIRDILGEDLGAACGMLDYI